LLLLVRHLVGHAVGDAMTLPKPLKRPGPMPELEKAWQLRANMSGKTKKAKAAQRLTAKGQANGRAALVTNGANGISDTLAKGGRLKKTLTPNGRAVVVKKAG
jgi:hypothetical protein